MEGDQEFARELVRVFIESGDAALRDISAALSCGDQVGVSPVVDHVAPEFVVSSVDDAPEPPTHAVDVLTALTEHKSMLLPSAEVCATHVAPPLVV